MRQIDHIPKLGPGIGAAALGFIDEFPYYLVPIFGSMLAQGSELR